QEPCPLKAWPSKELHLVLFSPIPLDVPPHHMKHVTRQKVGWLPQMPSVTSRRAPIGGGEDNRPELGGGTRKFKRHVVELQPGVVDTHHSAALLHASSGIVQQEGLTHMEFRLHFQQPAMGIHNLGFRLFPQLAAL